MTGLHQVPNFLCGTTPRFNSLRTQTFEGVCHRPIVHKGLEIFFLNVDVVPNGKESKLVQGWDDGRGWQV